MIYSLVICKTRMLACIARARGNWLLGLRPRKAHDGQLGPARGGLGARPLEGPAPGHLPLEPRLGGLRWRSLPIFAVASREHLCWYRLYVSLR